VLVSIVVFENMIVDVENVIAELAVARFTVDVPWMLVAPAMLALDASISSVDLLARVIDAAEPIWNELAPPRALIADWPWTITDPPLMCIELDDAVGISIVESVMVVVPPEPLSELADWREITDP